MSCTNCGCKSCRCCKNCGSPVCSCSIEQQLGRRFEESKRSSEKRAARKTSQGWQCPVCKAVMAPFVRVCVNCK